MVEAPDDEAPLATFAPIVRQQNAWCTRPPER